MAPKKVEEKNPPLLGRLGTNLKVKLVFFVIVNLCL
jgi:hypothetical protein